MSDEKTEAIARRLMTWINWGTAATPEAHTALVQATSQGASCPSRVSAIARGGTSASNVSLNNTQSWRAENLTAAASSPPFAFFRRAPHLFTSCRPPERRQ